jgi:hypothetical protein
MTTLAQVRRASAHSHNPHVKVPAVQPVAACVLCRLPVNAPGACPGRPHEQRKSGLGHEAVQYTTNRATRRARWIRDVDGEKIARARTRGQVLTSTSRLAMLHGQHRADWRRITGASEQRKHRLLAQRAAAEQRNQRRLHRPGRLRAELFQAAWRAARAVKRLDVAERRTAAVAKADEAVARMTARRGAA